MNEPSRSDEVGPESEGLASSTLALRVRYSHTDCGGVVYHANYLDYFEWGRTEFLRERAAREDDTRTYREMEREGFQLVVVDAGLEFHRAAHYDDELVVRTILSEVTGVRLRFRYEIRRPGESRDGERGGDLICTGTTTLACLDRANGRPRRLPEWLRARR